MTKHENLFWDDNHCAGCGRRLTVDGCCPCACFATDDDSIRDIRVKPRTWNPLAWCKFWFLRMYWA